VIQRATRQCNGLLARGFPDDVPFESENIPEIVQEHALHLAIYHLANRRQAVPEDWKTNYDNAVRDLRALSKPGHVLLFPDGSQVWSEGSAQAEPNTGAWSSMADKTAVFSDDSLTGF